MSEATLLVRHQVEDYAAWRSVYDSLDGLRKEHGCTGEEVMVDPADKQDVSSPTGSLRSSRPSPLPEATSCERA